MATKLTHLLGAPGRREEGRALTERELEILGYIAQGMSNKGIAKALDISHDTVKLHVRHILSKLNLSSRVEAAVYAVGRKFPARPTEGRFPVPAQPFAPPAASSAARFASNHSSRPRSRTTSPTMMSVGRLQPRLVGAVGEGREVRAHHALRARRRLLDHRRGRRWREAVRNELAAQLVAGSGSPCR